MSENKLKRKRQSDQRKQEVKGVKQVEKNAQESQRGHQNSKIKNALALQVLGFVHLVAV